MSLVQVTPQQGRWKVLVDGSEQGRSFGTQQEAMDADRARARELGAEFQLHGEDGSIRGKDSYGNDPRDIEG